MKKQVAALALCLLLTACGEEGKASNMQLIRTEGAVGVSDGEGKAVQVRENLKLYSGYQVGTQTASYAWMDLDAVKLAKLDSDSELSIQTDGRSLELVLTSGSVFFNVTAPLAEEETMTIRTANMAVGIRGTCGWVTAAELETVYVLEGTVTVAAGEQEESVTGGEMAASAQGVTVVRPYTQAEIVPFVMAELEADEALQEKILRETGMDVLAPPPEPSEQDENSRLIDSGEWGDIEVRTENVTICGTASVQTVTTRSGNVYICGNASVGQVTTYSGNVEVYEEAAAGNISTRSGNVEICDNAAAGDIQTENGNITVRDNGMIGTAATVAGRIEP